MYDKFPMLDPANFTKVGFGLDPTKMFEEMIKAWSGLGLPGVDVVKVVESQRRNMEALAAVTQLAQEGMEAVVTRQREMLQRHMDEASRAIQDLATSGDPATIASKQADLLRVALERAFADAREIANLIAKYNSNVIGLLSSRITESMQSVKEMAGEAQKTTVAPGKTTKKGR